MKGEKRDGASQMPKTARIGYQPNVTNYPTSPIADQGVNRVTFQMELTKLLNLNSVDAELNTPDFILAEFLIHSLNVFKTTQDANVEWHGAQTVMRMG